MFSQFCLICTKRHSGRTKDFPGERFMSRLGDFKFLRLVPLAAFFFALPALAQFEVAPDHFDPNGKNASARKSASDNKAFARPAAAPAVGRASAGTIAKGRKKSTRGSAAGSTGGTLNARTHAAPAAVVLGSRNARRKQEKQSDVAKAMPALSQRE
jgi:hypothetical protein